MATVKTNEIEMPPHYIRGKTKNSYVNDLLSDLADFNGVKDWHELIPPKQKKGDKEKVKKIAIKWPFPNIDLARNPKDVQSEVEKKKQTAQGKKYFPFELIDGAHRLAVARHVKMKEIDATIKQDLDPTQRFLLQWKTNVAQGLRLDKDSRDNAIRLLAKEFSFSQKALVHETGLNVGSISRILSGKQRTGKPRKASTIREKISTDETGKDDSTPSNTNKNQKHTGEMSIEGWTERLQICCSEFPRLKEKILAHLVSAPNKKALAQLAERTLQIAIAIEDIVQGKFPPATIST